MAHVKSPQTVQFLKITLLCLTTGLKHQDEFVVPTSSPQRKPTETGLGSEGGRAGICSLANSTPPSCHPPRSPWRCPRIGGDRRDGQHNFQRALGLSNWPPCSELALKIQYLQICWGERRMGFGMRYLTLKSTWITFWGTFPFFVQHTAFRTVLYPRQLTIPLTNAQNSPFMKMRGWLQCHLGNSDLGCQGLSITLPLKMGVACWYSRILDTLSLTPHQTLRFNKITRSFVGTAQSEKHRPAGFQVK